MSLTLVTAATIEPLTLAQAKEQLRLETDCDDALLMRYITAARKWVEGQTKRAITAQTWDQAIDYHWPWKFGGRRIDLALNPVASVTTVTYIDDAGASQTLASSQYIVLEREHGSFIAPAYDAVWPSVRHIPGAITVRFICGSDTEVPEELQQAIAIYAAYMYDNRGESDVDVPSNIETLISPYRDARVA